MRLIEKYAPKPWKERPDGYRLCDNLYLEFDRKFEWPNFENDIRNSKNEEEKKREVFCKALIKQIGVLADGTLVPCCLDHNGDVALGNLLHQSLEEILSSERAQAMTEGFKHHTATEALCENCESALVKTVFEARQEADMKLYRKIFGYFKYKSYICNDFMPQETTVYF